MFWIASNKPQLMRGEAMLSISGQTVGLVSDIAGIAYDIDECRPARSRWRD
jgi:hypothetical protein